MPKYKNPNAVTKVVSHALFLPIERCLKCLLLPDLTLKLIPQIASAEVEKCVTCGDTVYAAEKMIVISKVSMN